MKKKEAHIYPAKPILRLKAFIFDLLILFIPGIFINSYLASINLDKTTLTIFSGVFNIFCFGYFVFFTYKKSGQTLGKKFMKIKVVSEVGALSLSQVVLRYGLLFLVFWAIPFFLEAIGFKKISDPISAIFVVVSALMLFIDRRRQIFHDKISKTIVVENTP